MVKYINADELYDAISDNWCGIGVCNINDILNFIEEMYTADVQEIKHGRNMTDKHPVDEFICSECEFMIDDISEKVYDEDGDYYFHREYEIKYCPNCGAKMEELSNDT